MSSTAASLQPPERRARARTARLPYGWPLYVAFGGFPLWWFLGFGAMIWFVLAVPMTISLVSRSKVRVPKGFGLFALFLIWMSFTAVQLHGSSLPRYFGFAYRAGLYYSAAVWLLYIYNAPKRLLPTSKILKVMAFMWLTVVAGGWLGILAPNLQFSTLTQAVLPASLVHNDLVYTLVHPHSADVQKFLGYNVPRPAAPFDFTNNWGGNFALLMPFVLAYWAQIKTLARRNTLALIAAGSMIPVIFSLNRTLWLCLIVTLIYGGFRFAIRGRRGVFQAICAVAVVGFCLFNFGPTAQLIKDRSHNSNSNQGRSILATEAAQSVGKSPLLGYGGPQPSTVNPNLPPVGTQGQFWLVFFSHGIPGAFFFVGFFVYAAWRTRKAKTTAALWCHVVLLLAIIQMPFYSLLHMQIHILAIAFALASREMADPDVDPEPAVAPATRAYVVSDALLARPVPALTGVGSNGRGNGHAPVKGRELTTWGRAGDAPEGWS
jgi:polysaccharide biosynthesis protein PslJ